MSKTISVKIKPELLIWARETAGFTVADAAKKIHVSVEKLQACELGELQLTFKQLQDAANTYKRPLALFFLESPPAREPNIHDFRLDPEASQHALPPSVHIEIRRAKQHRQEALELAQQLEEDIPHFVHTASADEPPETIAKRLDQLLGLSRITSGCRTIEEAYKARKSAVERLGVLVFETSRVPSDQMRGVSLPFDEFPVVMVNGADSHAGRSFTLLHELTHILLRQGGVCDLAPTDLNTVDATTERFCNAVAAAALMPAERIREMVSATSAQTWSMEQLAAVAKPLKVSREALMVRFVTLGLATIQHYLAMRPLFREEYLKYRASQKSEKGGGPSPAVMAVRNLGKPFVSLVLDAYASDRIGLATVSDYLGVKLKHLPKIRGLVIENGIAA